MKSFRLSAVLSSVFRLAGHMLLFQLFLFGVHAQTAPNARDLLRQMTIEEKVAQLSQLPAFPIPEFRRQVGVPIEQVIRENGAGSVLWVSDPKRIDRLQHVAVEQSRLHIPLLFGLDVVSGYHTIFPAPIAMGVIVGSGLVL
jgi:beta-glucosidase